MFILFQRSLPYVSSIIITLLLYAWDSNPTTAAYMVTGILMAQLLALWALTRPSGPRRQVPTGVGSHVHRQQFMNFVVTPMFFMAGAVLFYLFVDYQLVRVLFILGVALINLLLQRNIFAFLHATAEYQPKALENIYSYVSLITVFLLAASSFGASLLLGWAYWPLVIGFTLMASLLTARTLWAYKLLAARAWWFVLLIGVTLGETAWAVSFFPTSYIFNALVVVAVYYVFISIIKDVLRGSGSAVSIRRYVATAAVLVTAAALTTRWY